MIKERLNIKLKALNLARERAEAKARGERVYATGEWYKDAISQAKTKPNCYLWMCTTQRDNVMPVQWAEVHECFTVLLRALTLVQDVLGTKSNQSLIRNAMQLLAEAQSAVRVVCDRFDDEDGDQLDVYLHLLEWSAAEQVYIARYMKSDDFAAPAQSRDLLRRVNDCARDLTEVNAAWQLRENLIKKIRYEANSLTKSPLNPLENWRKIIASVDQLIVSVTARAI